MEPSRIAFFSSTDRNLFFDAARTALGLKSWKEVYHKFGVIKSKFEYYRNGKLLIPKTLFFGFD